MGQALLSRAIAYGRNSLLSSVMAGIGAEGVMAEAAPEPRLFQASSCLYCNFIIFSVFPGREESFRMEMKAGIGICFSHGNEGFCVYSPGREDSVDFSCYTFTSFSRKSPAVIGCPTLLRQH